MGRKGWAGAPPSDDEEAVARIVAATIHHVEMHGAGATTMQSIADDLGITRRTLYRYFEGVDDLFRAVGDHAFATYQARLAEATAHLTSPAALAVESVAWIVETIATEPLLTLLVDVGHTAAFTRSMLTSEVIDRCREILRQRDVDWARVAADDTALDELIEYLLRLIQSLVLAPTDRSSDELRATLRRWIGPVFSVT